MYHATTASARAAQLAAAAHRAAAATPSLRAERAERAPLAQLPSHSHPRAPLPLPSPSSSSPRRVRVVLEKRLIRGSAVFRTPTEQDIDEYLRLESSRQMAYCRGAAVDVPPKEGASCCETCGARVRRALPPCSPRISSLLSKNVSQKSAVQMSSSHACIDLTQLATLDECTAVAIFLRRLRAQKSQMMFSVRARHVYPADKLSTVALRKTSVAHPRSLSADDPALMLPSSPNVLVPSPATVSCVPSLVFDNPRARSELLPSPPSVSDAASVTPTRHAASTLTNFSVPRVRSSKSPPIESRTFKFGQNRPADEQEEDDDTTTAAPLRILTAIEPVDPAGAVDDAQLCRGSSYHVGQSRPDVPLFRRRRRTSGVDHADNGFRNKLQRLRSFRRRPDSWSSIVRRFSTQRDVNAR